MGLSPLLFPFLSGGSESWVVFLFSSDGTRFESAKAVGELALGDLSEHGLGQQGEFPWWSGGEVAAEGQGHSDGAGEAESHRVGVVLIGGLEQEASDDVQGRHAGGEFVSHAIGGVAAKHVGMQVDLQLAEEGFDAPPAAVEFHDFVGGIRRRVE